MTRWTQEQVLALAPDSASASSGRELSNPAKWVSAGSNEAMAWGEARGSGANPYQTAIDLSEPAFKCSCPSRKFPCKHALGLFLRFAKGEVVGGEPPGWASDWLQKRTGRATVKAERVEAQESAPDPAAAAKRAEKRWTNILNGLEETEAFLTDVVSQGLLYANKTRSWDQMAARMVDCQAPGVATRLKAIGSKIGVGKDWAYEVTSAMGNLMLLVEASRKLESFEPDLQADIRAALGLTLRKEDLPEELAVTDIWDVLGQSMEIEDRLTVCRSWLRGRQTQRWALHLAFSAAGQPFDVRLVPGTAFSAKAHFYPSAWPLRVHFDERLQSGFNPAPGRDWASSLDEASWALCKNPWVESLPVLLENAVLGRDETQAFAIDGLGRACTMVIPSEGLWRFLAMSGNRPSEFFGVWNGRRLELRGVWGSWGYVGL